jgi:hypothetical protein
MPAAMLHRQMREARAKWWARKQAAKGKNDDKAGPSRAPANGQYIRIKFKFYLSLNSSNFLYEFRMNFLF